MLYGEEQFRKVKGHAKVAQVMAAIEAEQAESQPAPVKKAA